MLNLYIQYISLVYKTGLSVTTFMKPAQISLICLYSEFSTWLTLHELVLSLFKVVNIITRSNSYQALTVALTLLKKLQSIDSFNLITLWGGATQVVRVVKNPSASAGRHKRYGLNPSVGKIPCRRAQQSTTVFLPRESHGQRSLVGCDP